MNLDDFYASLEKTQLKPWLETLPGQIQESFDPRRFGNLPKWEQALSEMPESTASDIDLNAAAIRIGKKEDLSDAQRKILETSLRILHPWRKGPFDLFGIRIETEWRSDLKWNRVQPHIDALEGKTVLDIGCGSGYHCWRMAGEKAALTIGIDTTMLYAMQFQAVQKYVQRPDIAVLPLSDVQLPEKLAGFDTVFSMGVLYHQKSPFDHLQRIHALLQEGGEAVIETLIIEGPAGQVLVPEDRYAQMRNVWFLPSALTLEAWLKRSGFKNIRLIDVNQTSAEEQRSTPWMTFQSLKDFLDPTDPGRTIEGYPAPRRAIFLVNK